MRTMKRFIKSCVIGGMVLGLLLGGSISYAIDLTGGLVASWSFDEDHTATVGGSAYDGTQSGVVSIDPSGRYGGAASFQRAYSEYLTVSAQVIQQGQEHSYSAWYKSTVSNIGSGRYFVLETTGPGGAEGYSASYGLRDEGGDIGQVFSQRETGAGFWVDIPGAAGTSWHNIVVTYDPNNTVTGHAVYLDGPLAATGVLQHQAGAVAVP